ncbi:MAG: hypothetical protein ACTXOO_04290 [Sodalis sp. (in: enterobacteria)]
MPTKAQRLAEQVQSREKSTEVRYQLAALIKQRGLSGLYSDQTLKKRTVTSTGGY